MKEIIKTSEIRSSLVLRVQWIPSNVLFIAIIIMLMPSEICPAYNMPTLNNEKSNVVYPPVYADSYGSHYPNVYDFMPLDPNVGATQGIDYGLVNPGEFENSPSSSNFYGSGKGFAENNPDDWNPIHLANLYPKLNRPSPETYSCIQNDKLGYESEKNAEGISNDKSENALTSAYYTRQCLPINKTDVDHCKEDYQDVWKGLLDFMTAGRLADINKKDLPKMFKDLDKHYASSGKPGKNNADHHLKKYLQLREKLEAYRDAMNNTDTSSASTTRIPVDTQNTPLPEKLMRKKAAQMRALQNLSKLKAMIHIAKEERRTVQHKREEARRQFLSEVAEELQLMSSAKLAEIEASKSYRVLAAAQKALADKDRDIHTLLEKEDSLYEDLTDAEASLAKADMNFIPTIKTEEELRKFASFLNFGF